MAKQQPDIEVLWVSGSPYSWRVLLALEVKQLPYRGRLLEASKKEHKTPEFLALNPRGKVPVLKDGDYILYESLAILEYLDRQYPQPSLFGRDARTAGRNWRLISEYVSYLDAPISRIVTPLYFDKSAERADDMRAAAPVIETELKWLERALSEAPWLGGETIGAADIAIYPFIQSLLRATSKDAASAFHFGFLPLADRYPHLDAWRGRVEKIPGYDRTYPPHWRQ